MRFYVLVIYSFSTAPQLATAVVGVASVLSYHARYDWPSVWPIIWLHCYRWELPFRFPSCNDHGSFDNSSNTSGGGVRTQSLPQWRCTHTLSQTTGLVVATRLSEDPSASILVLEAGGHNLNDPEIGMMLCFHFITPTHWHTMYAAIPAYGRNLGKPQYDWKFSTVGAPLSVHSRFDLDKGASNEWEIYKLGTVRSAHPNL